MPLYSDIYHSYLGSSPISYTSSQPSVYSLPSYSSNYSPTYTSSPRITSSSSRYLPKLTTISETPLSKHRLAALTRISSPKTIITRRISPKYIPPRPRRIDTHDIDVSAQRFANRRISELKEKEPLVAPIQEVTKDESVDDIPSKGRSTIRRDRALVRLRTVHLRSKSKSPPPEEKVVTPAVTILENKSEEKVVDFDPGDLGYGSSERSSGGSWRNNFEGELDLYDRKVTSPTAKTPGESFFEKYHIKESEDVNMHYLTLDDVPVERRDSVRRRSGAKLPSFKEICSDISSDKLNDDLNAGDLRRRASLIIEEEINKIRQSESGTILCTLVPQTSDNEDFESDKRKSRKVKKVRQKITAKTSIENREAPIKAVIANVEIEETAFNVAPIAELKDEVSNQTFKLPLKKKKKLTDVAEAKITCDPIVSPNESAVVATTIAEIETNEKDDRKTHEPIVNIKSENSDLDSKLLLDKPEVNELPGELKKVKKAVKNKTPMKTEALPTTLNPLRRDLSADDFWGMMGSRETTNFTRRKQQVIAEQTKKIESWREHDEANDKSADCQSVPKDMKTSGDKPKTSAGKTEIKITSLDMNSKAQHAKKIDNKSESLKAIATNVDKEKILDNKSSSSDLLEASKAEAKKTETKVNVSSAKVTEPQVEENVTKVNKFDAAKADKVSDVKVSTNENNKINEVILKPTENKEENILKLQPVPKPSKLTIAQKPEKIELEKPTTPKSPPWKIQKKSEEKLPDTPKSPPSKLAKVEEPKKADEVKIVPEIKKVEDVKKIEEKKKLEVKKLDSVVDSAKKLEAKAVTADTSPIKKQTSKSEEKSEATETKAKAPLVKKKSPKLEEKLEALPAKLEAPLAKKKSPKAKESEIKSTEEASSLEKATIAKPLSPSKVLKTSDQKLSLEDKSKPTPDSNKDLATEINPETIVKVNDQASVVANKKKSVKSCEGQKLETEETKALNETKNTQASPLNTDEPKLVNSSSKKSLGTLSKFPTLNNLNDIASEAIADKQPIDQSNNEIKTTESESELTKIFGAVESFKANDQQVSEKKEELESESEESSYEETEESSDEMEKKNFDPQRKVKIDISQMKKCYAKDETSKCYLVARPRPLWKIKRNRHAVFSESESESSAEEATETQSTAGDSAASSRSSTQSDKPKKKVAGKNDSVSDNITALMPAQSVQDQANGDDSVDSESKKKNRLSSGSNDSGFCGVGATAAKSPRKAMGE